MRNSFDGRNSTEKVEAYDELWEGGRLLAGGKSTRIVGRVHALYRSEIDGHPIFTSEDADNTLLIVGGVFLSERINNWRSTFAPPSVDEILGVHTVDQIDRSNNTIAQEKVCGFMIGIGGSGDVWGAIRPVHRTALTVPEPIPFRVVPVSEDLTGNLRRRYILRVVRGNYVYYYGRRFDATRDINVEYEDGTVVPSNAYIGGDVNGKFVKTFTKYHLDINEVEVREYFKMVDGSTLRSRVNSVGLITGYPGRSTDGSGAEEYFNVRTITTANLNNRELKDTHSTADYDYLFNFI